MSQPENRESRERLLEAALRQGVALVEECQDGTGGWTAAEDFLSEARALLGPSPEGSPRRIPCILCSTWHADDSAACPAMSSEPPEGTETHESENGLRSRTETESAETEAWRRPRRSDLDDAFNGAKEPRRKWGETEDEAMERRGRASARFAASAEVDRLALLGHVRDIAKASWLRGAEDEARHLSTRTTPDPRPEPDDELP